MSEEQQQVEGTVEPRQRYRREHDEKDEKDRREEDEKREEKEEKDRPRDPLSSILWALFLIGAGVVLLAQSQGLITWDQFGGLWNLFFIGLGLLLLLEVALRLLLPAYRRPVFGQLIGGLVLLAIGLGGMVGFRFTGPLILIGVGAAILLGALVRGDF